MPPWVECQDLRAGANTMKLSWFLAWVSIEVWVAKVEISRGWRDGRWVSLNLMAILVTIEMFCLTPSPRFHKVPSSKQQILIQKAVRY